MATSKPIHTIVIDAGPIIRNEVSRLRTSSEELVTTPAIVGEIKDAAARSLLETTLMPFLTLRSPKPESMKIVADFSRKTGDYAVLSKNDLEIIALAYEIECERNGGNWRLRSTPGQKRTNGPPPSKKTEESQAESTIEEPVATQEVSLSQEQSAKLEESTVQEEKSLLAPPASDESSSSAVDAAAESMNNLQITPESASKEEATDSTEKPPPLSDSQDQPASEDSESDSEGWITPSNLKKHQAKDANSFVSQTAEPVTMQVATISGDFALQNVLLQMNLNLITSSLQRVKHLKTYILRCHACFATTKQMDKQFCARCGKPTLTRVSCSTNANGEFKIHLKKNMQWNSRGDRFSIPKPVAGSANGRVTGGGKGGWGQELILVEDQKEYVRGLSEQKRQKQRDLMDEDYLPSILTGDRGRSGGRIRVGAGKNVNSRKR